MTTIPRAYVDNFTRVINGISDDAQKKLAKALEGVVIDDIAAARNEIIAIMDTLLAPYTDNVAAVAATFYDGLRAYFGIDDGFMAESESMREPAATAGAVRAFMQTQVDGKPFETLENLLTERVDYECKRAANECIAYNAKNDPKRPKWARVPTGAETCEWCIMLASRGFAYLSEEAASHTHANCDCRVIPSWDKDNPAVQGYDPDLYYDMWKHPEKYKEAQLEQKEEIELVKISAEQFPDAFTSTKGKRQSFETFAETVNSVDGADPKIREIFSRTSDIASRTEALTDDAVFDAKYAAGKGSVNTTYTRVDSRVSKLTVNMPKMDNETAGGTVGVTCHELGHYIDVLMGKDGERWLSTEFNDFLRTDYTSLPASERRAAAAAHSESVRPKGRILEIMRQAEDRRSQAVEEVRTWYNGENDRLAREHTERLHDDSLSSAERDDLIKGYIKDRKALKKERDRRADVAGRQAMAGVEAVEDIYDALNSGYIQSSTVDGVKISYGHGPSYYRSNAKKVEEIWANYCQLSLTRPDLIDAIADDQPELIHAMDSMRDEILVRLNG